MTELRCLPQDLLLIQAAPRMTIWGHLTLLSLDDILASPKYFLSCQSRLYPADEIRLCRMTSVLASDKKAKVLEFASVLVGAVNGDGVVVTPRYPGVEKFGEAPAPVPYPAKPTAVMAAVLATPTVEDVRTILAVPEPPAPVLRAEKYAPNPNAVRGWRVIDDTGRVVADKMTEEVAKRMAGEVAPVETAA